MTLDISKPELKNLLSKEFKLQGEEIKGLESQIQQYFLEIILNHQKIGSPLRKIDEAQNPKQNTPLQNISETQRQEIESFQTLDYSQYPVAPCVQSLYYISKIAQNQQVNIYVPPTILIMSNEETKFMYNDVNEGHLIVEAKKINEQMLIKFIKTHMNPILNQYSFEAKLLVPKFIIRIAQNQSRKNDCKVYFSQDTMIADALSYWGNCDMAIQLYVKYKCVRPMFYRYYMKSGNIHKSVQISNRLNVEKDSHIFRTMQQILESQQLKPLQSTSFYGRDISKQNIQSSRSVSNNNLINKNFSKSFAQSNSKSKLHEDDTQITEDQNDFIQNVKFHENPKKLQSFKLSAYENELQVIIPSKKLMKAYCCTATNIKNLKIMSIRPSAFPLAEKMTLDLYRLFNQYYLKTQKFGNISKFVCDFIEGENGLIYLLQVKSFECEGVKHDWQQQWIPSITKAVVSPLNSQRNVINDIPLQIDQCQAKIICQNQDLNQKFIESLQQLDMWKLNQKKNYLMPKVSQKQIIKYKNEVDYQRSEWREFREKFNVCPLIPLITFKEIKKEYASSSPSQRRRHTRGLSNQFQNQNRLNTDESSGPTPQSSLNVLSNRDSQMGFEKLNQKQASISRQKDVEVNSCVACFKILELFQQRYSALTFKSDEVVNELKYLKLSFIDQWTKENILFMLKQYKLSKILQYKVPAIDKLQKLKHVNEIQKRSQTPDSVTRRNSYINTTQRIELLDQVEEQDSSKENSKQNLIKMKHKRYMLQQYQQDGILKVQDQRNIRQRLGVQSQSYRQQQSSQLTQQTTPTQVDRQNHEGLFGKRKSSYQVSSKIKNSLIRRQSSDNLNEQPHPTPNIVPSKSYKNILKPLNPRTFRDQLSTIETIYKEIPSQKSFQKETNTMKSSINNKELSNVINSFGLKLQGDLGKSTIQENDTSLPSTSRNNNYFLSQEKSNNLPQKYSKNSFFKSFVGASIQQKTGDSQSPNSIPFINQHKDMSQQQMNTSALQQNSHQRGKLTQRMPWNNYQNLPLPGSQKLSVNQSAIGGVKQSQNNQMTADEQKSSKEREQDLSMYFNNKRNIQNSKDQLNYRNLISIASQYKQMNSHSQKSQNVEEGISHFNVNLPTIINDV
eukprot:403330707